MKNNRNTVLIVDDEINICEVIRLYVEKEGFDSVIAHDGVTAIDKFKQTKPDIVLLDIMLPIKDGWQVCREIRAMGNTPIIMITAKGETFDKVLGLELGADDYIVKPFEPKELIARIKAVLRRFEGQQAPVEENGDLEFKGLKNETDLLTQNTQNLYGVKIGKFTTEDKSIADSTNAILASLGYSYKVSATEVASVTNGVKTVVMPGMKLAEDGAVEANIKNPAGPFAELFA